MSIPDNGRYAYVVHDFMTPGTADIAHISVMPLIPL